MKHLKHILWHSTQYFPHRVALKVDGQGISYQTLFQLATPLIRELNAAKQHRVAILADRHAPAYIALYACVLAGKTFVPLSPKASIDELNEKLAISDTTLLLTDRANSKTRLKADTLILEDHYGSVTKDLQAEALPETSTSNNEAYIMFTSGSTGKPKGVCIGQTQLLHYLTVMQQEFRPNEQDRFSQLIDLTFDLAIHDIFLCWSVGATLCVFNGDHYLHLPQYIQKNQLSFWLSAPSVGIALQRLKLLSPNKYHSLKTVFFCGEPLPEQLANAFSKAATQANIYNVYGPTEATIAFSTHLYQTNELSLTHQIVPIGKPLPGLKMCLHANETRTDSNGVGELLLGGPQIAKGYLGAPELTAEKFIQREGETWYQTGDLATQDSNGVFYFKGRIDEQLQVQGQRIERLALETRFREFLDTADIAIIPSPVTPEGLVLGIALIYIKSDQYPTEQSLRQVCSKKCQAPFLPTAYHALEAMPLTDRAKVDYQALCHNFQSLERITHKTLECAQ